MLQNPKLDNTWILFGAFFRVTFKRSSTVILGLFNNGVEHFLVGVKLHLLLFGVVGVTDGAGDWKETKGKAGEKERKGVGRGGGGGGIEGSDNDDVDDGGSGGGGGGGGSGGGGGGGESDDCCFNDADSVMSLD